MEQDFEVSIDADQSDVESVSVQKNGVFDKINRHTRTLAMWTLGLIGGGGIGCAYTIENLDKFFDPDRESRQACSSIDSLEWKSSNSELSLTYSYARDPREYIQEELQDKLLLTKSIAKCKNPTKQLLGLYMLGVIAESGTDLSQAEIYYREALDFIEKNPVPEDIAKNIQRALMRIGNYKAPCKAILQAEGHQNWRAYRKKEKMQIMQENVDQCEDNFVQLLAYARLALWYHEHDEFCLAEKYYRKILEVSIDIDKKLGPFICHNNDCVWHKPKWRGYNDNLHEESGLMVIGQRKTYAEMATTQLQYIQKQKEDAIKEYTKATQELLTNLQYARNAENQENHQEAIDFYEMAKKAGYSIESAYDSIDTEIPQDIASYILTEIPDGITKNKHFLGRTESSSTYTSSNSAFEEGIKMVGQMAVEALPYIGAGTEALAAYVREDLDRRGLTATVEISIAEYTFLSRYPIEDVEITIRRLGGSNFSQTSKTSKENLLETGGRVHFYLAPGWYEISSPLFKYSRTVELKKGLQSLEFQLR